MLGVAIRLLFSIARRGSKNRRARGWTANDVRCNVQQLKLEIDPIETDVALDLRQVQIVDREAVRFLARCVRKQDSCWNTRRD